MAPIGKVLPGVRVVVVGGGIAGLATAVALRRAGARVTVHERADRATASVGTGLVVWHNGSRALRAIGLGDRLALVAQPLDRYVFASARTGATLADWSLRDGARTHGDPAYTVSRQALHPLLVDATGPDLRTGAPCIGFTEDADGVDVHFADGGAERADLLVGADGLRSVVRRGLFPFESMPRPAGLQAWQGIAHVPDLPIPDGAFVNTFGRGAFFVYYGLGDGAVYWDAVLSMPAAARAARLGVAPAPALSTMFAAWPEPIPSLLAAPRTIPLSPVDVVDRPSVARWSTSRVTLVGDAAQPMTFSLGQGANQALEGAAVLAACLVGVPEISDALDVYERRRSRRAAAVAARSRFNSVMSRWDTPALCATRTAFMRLAFPHLIRRATYALTMNTGELGAIGAAGLPERATR